MKIKLFTILLIALQTFNLFAVTNCPRPGKIYEHSQRHLRMRTISDSNYKREITPTRIVFRGYRCSQLVQYYNPFVNLKMVNSYLYHDSTIAKKKDKVSYNITVDQSFTGITITVIRQGGPNIVPYVIQNNMGRDLAQGELSYAGSEVETSINISSMSKGSYSITVGEGSESSTTFFQVK